MKIIAIDPGTSESGYVYFDCDSYKILDKGIKPNEDILTLLKYGSAEATHLVIESILVQYARAAGVAVFETAYWSGRFVEAWGSWFTRMSKPEVSYHLCGRRGVKDADTRNALVALLGPAGKKADPGPTYGISKHMWDALALAVVFADQWRMNNATAKA